MSMLNVLLLEGLDIEAIAAELQKKHDEAPQFFMQSPLIVDCSQVAGALEEDASALDFAALKAALLQTGFIPVGVRNAPAALNETVAQGGWAIMRTAPSSSASTNTTADAKDSQQASDVENGNESKQSAQDDAQQIKAPQTMSSMTIERPVRSGQQIYAANADMTILAPTSAGSEVVADGSIHVYGPLRGRVLAGARGNESARIFCQSLQAELIAIAGRYQLLDESDTELKGKPAMIRLEGEKLIIEPLV